MALSRRVAFLWIVCLLPSGGLVGEVKHAPNVVVVTIDTLRADHLGCYGYTKISPNIDAFAADNARFERAYTPVPVTLPAHTAIFTGTGFAIWPEPGIRFLL